MENKSFENFKADKHNLESKIGELIQEFNGKYEVELKDISFKTYFVYAGQETKTVEIDLDFDI